MAEALPAVEQSSTTIGEAPPAASSGTLPSEIGEALRRLDDLDSTPIDERPEAFEAVHLGLRSALAQIDNA